MLSSQDFRIFSKIFLGCFFFLIGVGSCFIGMFQGLVSEYPKALVL